MAWAIEGRADGGYLISEGVNSQGDGPERYVAVVKADRLGELRESDVRKMVAADDLLAVAKLLLTIDDEWNALSLDERARVEAVIAKAEAA